MNNALMQFSLLWAEHVKSKYFCSIDRNFPFWTLLPGRGPSYTGVEDDCWSELLKVTKIVYVCVS